MSYCVDMEPINSHRDDETLWWQKIWYPKKKLKRDN